MCSYLKKHKQRVANNSSASTSKSVVAVVPQESIDAPLPFNIFMDDLVLFIQYTILGYYSDDNNISINGRNTKSYKKLLLLDLKTLTECFYDNYMIIDPDKCSYMYLGKNNNDDDNLSFNEFSLNYSEFYELA